MFNEYIPLSEGSPMLTKATYDLVESHLVGRKLLPKFSVTKLDYVIASTLRSAQCDVLLTEREFRWIVDRLPVIVTVAGYSLGRTLPSSKTRNVSVFPTPMTPNHVLRFIDVLKDNAVLLNVSLFIPDDFADLARCIYEAGEQAGVFKALIQTDVSGVQYHGDTAPDLVYTPYGVRTNAEILSILDVCWPNLVVPRTDITPDDPRGVSIISFGQANEFTTLKVYNADHFNFKRYHYDPEIDILGHVARLCPPISMCNYIASESEVNVHLGDLAAGLQSEARLKYKISHPLLVTQMKLFHMLKVVSAYYGQSVIDYMTGLAVMDLCAKPGNMTQLMVDLKADVYSHALVGSYDGCSKFLNSVRPWLDVCNIDSPGSAWESNVTDCSDDHLYSLVVCDGYATIKKGNSSVETDEENNRANIDLFWTQAYVALRKVSRGGTVIIKAMVPPNDLFMLDKYSVKNDFTDSNLYTVSSSALTDFICMDGNFKLKLFSKFSHFALIKPICSTVANREYYVMFFNCRMTAPGLPVNDVEIALVLNLEYNLIRKRDSDLLAQLEKASVNPAVVPDDLEAVYAKFPSLPQGFSAIYPDGDYRGSLKTILRVRAGPCGYRAVSVKFPDLFRAWNKFTTPIQVTLSDREIYHAQGPAQVLGIEFFDDSKMDNFAHYADYVSISRTPLNFKGFIFKEMAKAHIANKWVFTAASDGAAHNPLWRGVLTWSGHDCDTSDRILAVFHLSVYTVFDRYSKADAEQECYKRLVEVYVGARILTVNH